MPLIKNQGQASPQRGLPVDDKGNSSSIVTITGETVQLYYNNAGTMTIDAGQVAGVAVVAQLAYNNVKNAIGSMEATFNDTSLSFTSTAFTAEVQVDWSKIESVDDQTLANRLAAITDGMSNGDYAVDPATGAVYGKKADTSTTLTATTYKVQSGVSSGGSIVDTEIEGNVAHDAVETGNPVAIGGIAASAQATAVAAADRVRAVFNLFGEQVIAGYTWATNSLRTEEIDPLSSHHLPESLVDTTNVSAATHHYPSATGGVMDGYSDQSGTGKFIDADGTVTLTLEVSNDEDAATADWVQVYFYDDKNNVTVNSLTVTNGTLTFAVSANVNTFRRYRWVVVASGATNTVILKERKKAL